MSIQKRIKVIYEFGLDLPVKMNGDYVLMKELGICQIGILGQF
ncbi:MAG: hypothetical protein ACPKQO_09555 [Nitrososphaeraceae archaeon]